MGQLIVGVALGATFSWLFTFLYYRKASRDQRIELAHMTERLQPHNTLANFERLLTEAAWEKVHINDKEVWICQSDNTYQIQRGESSHSYVERWTTVYPDSSATAYPVYLKIASAVVKELTFVHMDGFRIFVPMTEVRPCGPGGRQSEFFWNVNSLRVRVCNIIGEYYIHDNLAGVAAMSRVAIVS